MSQDIPNEGSELLPFTPECLKAIPNAPSFVLRAATPRDKRFHRRLITEEGLRSHSIANVRQAILEGLKQMWSPEAFEAHVPVLREYWEARDDFSLQSAADPDLKWDFDPKVEAAIDDLTKRVAEAWPPLRRMLADNNEFGEMVSPLIVSVIVKQFTGLPIHPRLERGYITIDTATDLAEALLKFEREHAEAYNLVEGAAWLELFVACTRRMRLDEEEAKNSASPSPSQTIQHPSTETNTSEEDGKSPASANSTETLASA